MNEGALGVHEVEFVIETRPGLGDRRRVRQHAAGARHLRQIAAGHDRRRLIVDSHLQQHLISWFYKKFIKTLAANLETSRAPVDELDGALRLDRGNRGVHVLGHDVTSEEQAHRHVFAVARIALQMTIWIDLNKKTGVIPF